MDGDNSNLGDNFDIKGDNGGSIQRKVIRGGSWKDIGYYLQTGSRSYEYQDTAKSLLL